MIRDLYISSASIKFVDNDGSVLHQIIADEKGISFTSGSGRVSDISGSIISG